MVYLAAECVQYVAVRSQEFRAGSHREHRPEA